MPLLKTSYDPEHGPTIEALVSLPGHMRRSRIEHQRIRLLVDSGATTCAIAPVVMQALELAPKGREPVFLAGGIMEMNHYLVDLSIPFKEGEDINRHSVRVIEFLGYTDQYQGLLGRDILDQGTFKLFGKEKEFSLRLD